MTEVSGWMSSLLGGKEVDETEAAEVVQEVDHLHEGLLKLCWW